MLKGKKTYTLGVLIVISAVLLAFQVISQEVFLVLLSIFGGGVALSTRAAIKKLENSKVVAEPTNK